MYIHTTSIAHPYHYPTTYDSYMGFIGFLGSLFVAFCVLLRIDFAYLGKRSYLMHSQTTPKETLCAKATVGWASVSYRSKTHIRVISGRVVVGYQ